MPFEFGQSGGFGLARKVGLPFEFGQSGDFGLARKLGLPFEFGQSGRFSLALGLGFCFKCRLQRLVRRSQFAVGWIQYFRIVEERTRVVKTSVINCVACLQGQLAGNDSQALLRGLAARVFSECEYKEVSGIFLGRRNQIASFQLCVRRRKHFFNLLLIACRG